MKSHPVEKKQILKLKVEDDDKFRLIGISSHENDYRLVWAINNQLKLKFIRIENLIVHNPKLKTELEFSRYYFHDEDKCLKYYLISNHCPNGFLFAEIKNFDFLMKIVGETNNEDIPEFSRKLKNVPIISAVFVLQPLKLKGIGQILQD